ncbi:MAG TPA: methylenetetrahydrofolate reductase [NAD(P)H], partial [Ruminococcaceae bacterium]|nr:methylenetetrahydrofolate reductase [NAD(P)H] [Oscillospiraceae bacterium]
YGAGGGTSEHTVDLAHEAKTDGVTALAHLTCYSSTKEKVLDVIRQLKEKGIENILALRGDRASDSPIGEFNHASELMELIATQGDFCVGGACYPECHPESASIIDDLDGLKRKVDSGCRFLTTQMFFDNSVFYKFSNQLRSYGIQVPLVAGIMPVTQSSQIERIVKLSGCGIPLELSSICERFADDPAAMKQAGIAFATNQIIDLIASGVNNIHIYTMNKPDIAKAIMDNLSDIIGKQGTQYEA